MLKRTKTILSLGLFTLIVGCQSIPGSDVDLSNQIKAQNVKTNSIPLTERTLQGWAKHVADSKITGPLQKGCEPYYKLAKGTAKGNVMLIHGYSACPQQYDELSAMLSDKGYNVFVPLIPGHGKIAKENNGKFTDESYYLPDLNSTFIYKNFAKNIGAILKDEPGTKVMGGLSLGGALAAKAIFENPGVYDRGFLMAPFFNAAGPMSVILPAVGEIIPNKRTGWGKDCEEQRSAGRAGYCNFNVTNVAAVRSFGLDTLKELGGIKEPIQVTGVEGDPAASNSAIAEAVKKLPNSRNCLFAKGAKHSMLSRIDNTGINMFWLTPLEKQIVEYVDTGKNFEVISMTEHNLGLCRSY